MLCLGVRARALRRPRRHHRPAGRRAGRAALRGLCRARRPGDRDQPDAEPARLHLGPRHRPRSRRGGPRQAEERRRAAGARRRPVPGLGHARLRAGRRASLPGLRAAPRARRARTARRRHGCSGACRRSACARSTRSSTSPTTSPSTAAGRCTSSTPRRSRAISPSAARGTARRSLALDGTTYTLDDRHRRHRRRRRRRSRSPASWAASIRAATRRTTDVLIESALWDPLNIAQTGRKLGINTDARYRFERGVDPAFMRAGPRSRDPHGARPLRRRAVRASSSPARSADTDRVIDFPWTEVRRLSGLDVPRRGIEGHPRKTSASTLRAPATA